MAKLQNRYKILHKLGQGAFGVTYLAEDHQRPGHPHCVVKELQPDRPDPASLPRIREFFAEEARFLEALGQHPYIPQLLAHFDELRRVHIFWRVRRFYIVQEYIEGSPLSQEIYPGKQRSQSYVLELLKECLETLAFVHRKGVIHRDIKPDNLMRRQSDQRIFLIDFGAVKQLTPTQMAGSGSVNSTVMIGTQGYMPYEQCNGKPRLASDVYALGMTAIAALTGKHPTELDEDPRTGELQWRHFAKVDQGLGDLLDKMVRYRHHERYESASTALAALNQLSGLPQKSPPPPVVATPYPPTRYVPRHPQPAVKVTAPSPQRRRFLTLAGLGGGGVLLAVAAPPLWEFSQGIELPELRPGGNSPPDPEPPSAPTPTVPEPDQVAESSVEVENASDPDPTPDPDLLPEPDPVPDPDSPSQFDRFEFETVRVNDQGEVVERQTKQADFFTEDLGNGVILDMVRIPTGEFLMGPPVREEGRLATEWPQRRVQVPEFFIGKFAVTQAQYQTIMGTNPSYYRTNGEQRPVERVNWYRATEFCQTLSEKTGRTYRLPSEAEWEYACRAGTDTPFYFGPTLTPALARYDVRKSYGNGPTGAWFPERATMPVGSFLPNGFGLFDLHGNVWEWCQDVWHDNYRGAPIDGSAWIQEGDPDKRVVRGGSWLDEPRNCRSGFRNWNPRTYQLRFSGNRVAYRGFRLVCVSA